MGKQTSGRRQGNRSVLLGDLVLRKGRNRVPTCAKAVQAKHEGQSSGAFPILLVIVI